MKLRKFYSLDNDVYNINMNTEDWSQNDLDLMVKFGEPEIDLGGHFSMTGLSYDLPHDLIKVMTDSPFGHGFDVRDYPTDAEDRADLWGTTISDRIVAAMNTLRSYSDSWTKEIVQNV